MCVCVIFFNLKKCYVIADLQKRERERSNGRLDTNWGGMKNEKEGVKKILSRFPLQYRFAHGTLVRVFYFLYEKKKKMSILTFVLYVYILTATSDAYTLYIRENKNVCTRNSRPNGNENVLRRADKLYANICASSSPRASARSFSTKRRQQAAFA